MFVHDGPYSQAVLRFTVNFELDFPKSRPVIRFGPDVYHCESSHGVIIDFSYDRPKDTALVS